MWNAEMQPWPQLHVTRDRQMRIRQWASTSRKLLPHCGVGQRTRAPPVRDAARNFTSEALFVW